MQVEATSGRALSVNIELQENMWTSDDIIPLNVSISGAPFNRDIILKWHLSDENGIIAIEWGAYGVPETFLIHNKRIIKRYVGPLNMNSIIEIKKFIE